tara:strand:+ start:290 stop:1054 length:765 start_codon:yes stop_codon:yes gene_type:complete
MVLKAEQIKANWEIFLNNIEVHISGNRGEQLVNFYKKYEERIALMPAAHKKEYHSAFPGGYVYHVNKVVEGALRLYDLWEEMGCDMTTFTQEELVFSAINHDLGKMGDKDHESYIPQTDKWRREKLGEDYMFNKQLAFASVPDRGLFLLQQHDITYSFNEMVAIQTHDGLYDNSNEKYLKAYMPEQKPRTSLPFILHQADLMAARIEFEQEWLPKFKGESTQPKKETNTKQKRVNFTLEEAGKNSNLLDLVKNI